VRQSRFNEEQIIGIFRNPEFGEKSCQPVIRFVPPLRCLEIEHKTVPWGNLQFALRKRSCHDDEFENARKQSVGYSAVREPLADRYFTCADRPSSL
jgi:hypothetical protein